MKQVFKPLGDRVLVQPPTVEESLTAAGIIIPVQAKDAPIHGVVVSVGPGEVRQDGTVRPMQVKIGDTVLHGKYSGTDIELNGEKYKIMREAEITGILEEVEE